MVTSERLTTERFGQTTKVCISFRVSWPDVTLSLQSYVKEDQQKRIHTARKAQVTPFLVDIDLKRDMTLVLVLQ